MAKDKLSALPTMSISEFARSKNCTTQQIYNRLNELTTQGKPKRIVIDNKARSFEMIRNRSRD